MRKKVFNTMLLAVIFMTSCQNSNELSVVPSTSNAVKPKQDKNGHSYSTDAVTLAQNSMFIAYFQAFDRFAGIPFETFKNVETENWQNYNVTYSQFLNNLQQNPTQNNAEIFVMHIGFGNLMQFEQQTNEISAKKNALINNYQGFAGLSITEIDGLIEEATNYSLESAPPDFKAYKKCVQGAVSVLVSQLDDASDYMDFLIAIATYGMMVDGCKKAYGPNSK
jgi:hypothetical protein